MAKPKLVMEKEPIRDPAVLFFDIETTPLIVAAWALGKQHIDYKQILKVQEVMCISWAWGNGKVQHLSFDISKYDWYERDSRCDYEMLKKFVDMAQDADLVIGHNGKFFDVAFLRSRLIKLGLPDFNPNLIDDTYLMTKNIKFASHKLDFLGKELAGETKTEHGNGMEYWIDVMRGNATILSKMVKYCDGDVELLRDVYRQLKPYIGSNLNLAIWYMRPDMCPNCGSTRTPIIRHYKVTKAGMYPQFQCHDCGKYHPTGKNSIKNPGQYRR